MGSDVRSDHIRERHIIVLFCGWVPTDTQDIPVIPPMSNNVMTKHLYTLMGYTYFKYIRNKAIISNRKPICNKEQGSY